MFRIGVITNVHHVDGTLTSCSALYALIIHRTASYYTLDVHAESRPMPGSSLRIIGCRSCCVTACCCNRGAANERTNELSGRAVVVHRVGDTLKTTACTTHLRGWPGQLAQSEYRQSKWSVCLIDAR
jgi:hypothetical protein